MTGDGGRYPPGRGFTCRDVLTPDPIQ